MTIHPMLCGMFIMSLDMAYLKAGRFFAASCGGTVASMHPQTALSYDFPDTIEPRVGGFDGYPCMFKSTCT